MRRAVTWIKDKYFNSIVLNEASLEQWSAEWYFLAILVTPFFVLNVSSSFCLNSSSVSSP